MWNVDLKYIVARMWNVNYKQVWNGKTESDRVAKRRMVRTTRTERKRNDTVWQKIGEQRTINYMCNVKRKGNISGAYAKNLSQISRMRSRRGRESDFGDIRRPMGSVSYLKIGWIRPVTDTFGCDRLETDDMNTICQHYGYGFYVLYILIYIFVHVSYLHVQ